MSIFTSQATEDFRKATRAHEIHDASRVFIWSSVSELHEGKIFYATY